ncbi:MAG TPA: acyltransferase domain-containing protein, partial [Nannocystis sp.]
GNDGSDKIGFTAPSARGQATTLARAHAAAGVEVESIGYVESHGTATRLGDPIEIAALREVFEARTTARQFCALGAVKSNLGHLGAAAGVTGLIKATLALERQQIPGTLHFEAPAPALGLADSPFFVHSQPLPWPATTSPRRAGVSAFGVGGTSAHVILEESPVVAQSGPSRPWQALCLSARDAAALADRSRQLAASLRERPALALADVAHTLHRRPGFGPERQVVVGRDHADAIAGLESGGTRVVRGNVRRDPPKLVFVFPGGGTQHAGMGRALYADEPVFRAHLDACAERFTAAIGEDIRGLLSPAAGLEEAAAQRLLTPSRNMATIFAVEVALGQLLISWGMLPAAVIGHSLGEYAAALFAGVMTLDDAVALVATRGLLCDESPPAAMVSVSLSATDASRWLGPGLSLAAVNAADTCLISGPQEPMARLLEDLRRGEIEARVVPFGGAAHSALMDPLVPRLLARVRGVQLHSPRLPMISCVTGMRVADEVCSPEYWGRHLRETVRFHDALTTALADPEHVFIEVGPGGHLSGLIRRHAAAGPARLAVSAMQQPRTGRAEREALLLAVAQLWCCGVEVAWSAMHGGEQRRPVQLPTYPFARTQHLLPPAASRRAAPAIVEAAPPRRSAADSSEAPLPEPARTLAEIWAQLLGVPTVREGDNFYDLGGSSLVAIQVRARVLDRLGVTIPTHALVDFPTLGGLAAQLDTYPRADARPAAAGFRENLLVRLKSGHPGVQPLFLVQPLGGTVYTYLPLSRQLSWPGSIYGIRASGMEPGEPVFDDIHVIARRYLEEVTRVQPEGPVLLGGHSAGGIIAHEMAQQLLARGRSVSLVMLDAPSLPALREQAITDLDDLLRELTFFEAPESAAYQGLVTALCDGLALGPIMLATWRAIRGYEPRPLDCEVTYVTASEQRDPRDTRACLYWMDLTVGD